MFVGPEIPFDPAPPGTRKSHFVFVLDGFLCSCFVLDNKFYLIKPCPFSLLGRVINVLK